MKRKNTIILIILIFSVSVGFSILGVNAAIYGPKELPVIGAVYNWLAVNNKFVIWAEKQKNTGENNYNSDNEKTRDKSVMQNTQVSKAKGKKTGKRQRNPDFIMVATAYVDRGQTKSQMYAGIGSVAVDPKIVSHGTILYIEGYGLALATDTGRLIKGHSIDVWFSSESMAKKWGRKKVKVWKVGYADIKKILSTGGKYVNYFDNE